MPDLKFEPVNVEGSDISIRRAKVIGGWLVLGVNPRDEYQSMHSNGYGWRSSLVFVPDQNHEWGKEVQHAS